MSHCYSGTQGQCLDSGFPVSPKSVSIVGSLLSSPRLLRLRVFLKSLTVMSAVEWSFL